VLELGHAELQLVVLLARHETELSREGTERVLASLPHARAEPTRARRKLAQQLFQGFEQAVPRHRSRCRHQLRGLRPRSV